MAAAKSEKRRPSAEGTTVSDLFRVPVLGLKADHRLNHSRAPLYDSLPELAPYIGPRCCFTLAEIEERLTCKGGLQELGQKQPIEVYITKLGATHVVTGYLRHAALLLAQLRGIEIPGLMSEQGVKVKCLQDSEPKSQADWMKLALGNAIIMDAVLMMGATIQRAAEISADRDGAACTKLCVFANIPEDMPFMAGAYLGIGEADAVINVGVSGPGVVKKAVDRALASRPDLDWGGLSELIKKTAYKVTRVGELIGREVAEHLGIPFGVVDLSLAPTPHVGDSVGEIFQSLGLLAIGVPGTTAALALLNDAVKKGGAFASSRVGGLSGAFIPVSEDLNISEAARQGHLCLEKLEAITSVCSVGLDMVAIPGDTSTDTLSAIIADEMAIGVINCKTTATRLIPVPGKKAGDHAFFGGLMGESVILPVNNARGSNPFIRRGGLIPAPIHSLKN